jgi:hypothetical protein
LDTTSLESTVIEVSVTYSFWAKEKSVPEETIVAGDGKWSKIKT